MCFSEGSIGTLIIFWRKRLLYQLSHSHFHVFLILQYQESSILILLRWNEFKSRQSQQIFLFNWSERAANGRGQIYAFIFLKGTSSASFQTNIITFFTTMSIQYTALGFELTAFATWVSSHNYLARAPAFIPRNDDDDDDAAYLYVVLVIVISKVVSMSPDEGDRLNRELLRHHVKLFQILLCLLLEHRHRHRRRLRGRRPLHDRGWRRRRTCLNVLP